jgi:hypothetical protein
MPEDGLRHRIGKHGREEMRAIKDYDYLWRYGAISMSVAGLLFCLGIFGIALGVKHHLNITIFGSAGLMFIAIVMFVDGIKSNERSAFLRSEEDRIAEEHRWQLELLDAQKTERGRTDYEHELAALAQQMAHEINQRVYQEERDERRTMHLQWSQLVRQIEALRNTIVLAQVELRNSPAAEDILAQLKDLYDYAQTIDPDSKDIKPDSEAMTKMFEKIMLRRMGKQYGVNTDDI